LSRGILARGLVLQADPVATEAMFRGKRCERRYVTLDVEVAGQAPYQTRLNLRVPHIVEALPGATLDLRVHPSDPDDVEILGPAGACDWLNAAAAVPGQTWGPMSFMIPDAEAAPPAIPFDDEAEALAVAAIRGGGRAGVIVVVIVVVVLSLAVIGWVLVKPP
jgi:hypothetical protein